MIKLKYILGFLWTLGSSIVGWMILAFAAMFGGVESVTCDNRLIFIVDLKINHWFYRVFFKRRMWAGWSCGNVAFVSDPHSNITKKNKVVKHECEHCLQQYRWGVFWYPVYTAESIYLWFKTKKKHSYLDNHFERAARKAAGQLVDIPQKWWPNGPNDRWIFW